MSFFWPGAVYRIALLRISSMLVMTSVPRTFARNFNPRDAEDIALEQRHGVHVVLDLLAEIGVRRGYCWTHSSANELLQALSVNWDQFPFIAEERPEVPVV